MKRKNKEKDYLGKTTPSPLLQQIVKLRATDRQITSDDNNEGMDKDFVFRFSVSILDYPPQSKNV